MASWVSLRDCIESFGSWYPFLDRKIIVIGGVLIIVMGDVMIILMKGVMVIVMRKFSNEFPQ